MLTGCGLRAILEVMEFDMLCGGTGNAENNGRETPAIIGTGMSVGQALFRLTVSRPKGRFDTSRVSVIFPVPFDYL